MGGDRDGDGNGRDGVPAIDHRPPAVVDPPPVALVGCGGVTEHHLTAYREAGIDVVALCDVDRERARERREEFYPDADVYADAADVYAREDVAVVDVATHPDPRVGLIEDAITAGKHVLSQKPFVLDLDVGERLIERADDRGVRLAVNQNARWAPQFAYLRGAVSGGHLGRPTYGDWSVHWNHDWIAGTPFDDIDHAILYDFAIHWFDLLARIAPEGGLERISASTARSPTQEARPPLLAGARVDGDRFQASLSFDGHATRGARDTTHVSGTAGAVRSEGPGLNDQSVTLTTADGEATPTLEGSWFPTGFRGTMAELLAAVREDRPPENAARTTLGGLELCFAAVASAERGRPVEVGSVRQLPGHGDD